MGPRADLFLAFRDVLLEELAIGYDGADGVAVIVREVRTLQAYERHTDPRALLASALATFYLYGRLNDPTWYKPGPWPAFIRAAACDEDGAVRFCANVIRAELGEEVTRWTE